MRPQKQFSNQFLSGEVPSSFTSQVSIYGEPSSATGSENPTTRTVSEIQQEILIQNSGYPQEVLPIIPENPPEPLPEVSGKKGSKKRMRWTPDLHQSFSNAIFQLGGADRATPKGILQIMKVKDLTIFHVKSHLQKFRLARYGDPSFLGKGPYPQICPSPANHYSQEISQDPSRFPKDSLRFSQNLLPESTQNPPKDLQDPQDSAQDICSTPKISSSVQQEIQPDCPPFTPQNAPQIPSGNPSQIPLEYPPQNPPNHTPQIPFQVPHFPQISPQLAPQGPPRKLPQKFPKGVPQDPPQITTFVPQQVPLVSPQIPPETPPSFPPEFPPMPSSVPSISSSSANRKPRKSGGKKVAKGKVTPGNPQTEKNGKIESPPPVLTEALKLQRDMQEKLRDQLEVQRTLQQKIEAQGRYLQQMLEQQEETEAMIRARGDVSVAPIPPFLPHSGMPHLNTLGPTEPGYLDPQQANQRMPPVHTPNHLDQYFHYVQNYGPGEMNLPSNDPKRPRIENQVPQIPPGISPHYPHGIPTVAPGFPPNFPRGVVTPNYGFITPNFSLPPNSSQPSQQFYPHLGHMPAQQYSQSYFVPQNVPENQQVMGGTSTQAVVEKSSGKRTFSEELGTNLANNQDQIHAGEGTSLNEFGFCDFPWNEGDDPQVQNLVDECLVSQGNENLGGDLSFPPSDFWNSVEEDGRLNMEELLKPLNESGEPKEPNFDNLDDKN